MTSAHDALRHVFQSVQQSAGQSAPQVVPQSVPQTGVDTTAQGGTLSPQLADSLGVESLGAQDTTSFVGALAQDFQQSAEKAIQGRWAEVFEDVSRQLSEAWADMVPRLVSALFVLVLFYAAYRLLRLVLHRVFQRSSRVDSALEGLLMKTLRIVAVAFIVISVLGQFGINVTALLAGLSIVGLAVGLAAKDTLENFISGVTIFVDRPFRVGDSIEIEGIYGFVEEISMRSTRIRTLNNEMLVMPNLMMINQKLLNHTMHGTLRVQIPFGIAYKEFPQEARDVVLKITEGDDRLSSDYPPRVAVTQLNNSSVDMVLFLYLKDPRLEVPVKLDYVERVREALREADIEIPFPHLQLFVDEAKAFEGRAMLAPAHSRIGTSPPNASDVRGEGGTSDADASDPDADAEAESD